MKIAEMEQTSPPPGGTKAPSGGEEQQTSAQKREKTTASNVKKAKANKVRESLDTYGTLFSLVHFAWSLCT